MKGEQPRAGRIKRRPSRKSIELRVKSSSQISGVGIMATLGLSMLVREVKWFPLSVQSDPPVGTLLGLVRPALLGWTAQGR